MRKVLLFDASKMNASKVGALSEHPLHKRAAEWTKDDGRELDIANSLIAVMSSTGAVVVTAPEIGISKRVIVMNGHRINPEAYPEGYAMVMFNPQITEVSPAMVCKALQSSVSLPPLSVIQHRYAKITVVFTNVEGRLCRMEYEGGESAAVQLGIDQLDGVTLLDKSMNSYVRRLRENKKWMSKNRNLYTIDDEGLIWMNV